MKKTICATLLVASFALGNANASTLTLSNFGSTVASDGGWTYNATTSSITGPQAPAALLFPDPQPSSPFNLLTVGSVSDLKLRLTMNVTTSPSGGFTVSLEDNATPTAKQISTNFDWSAFTIGQSTAVEIPVYHA